MEDINSLGRVAYDPADAIEENSIFQEILRGFCFILYIFQAIIVTIVSTIKYIKNLFSPVEVKNIGGQLALVTGGGNGLGRAIALELAKYGCNVAILDLDIIAGEKTASDLRSLRVNAKAYKVDVSDFQSVKDVSILIEEDLGPVDIIINNAAIISTVSLHEGKPEDIEKIIRVNMTAHFWTTRVFIHSMFRRRKGHIVAICSLSGVHGLPKGICYSATKFGIRGFMESLYEDLKFEQKEHEIRLTTVFPYFINTRKDLVVNLKKVIPNTAVSFLKPEDVAEATVNGIIKNKRYVSVPFGMTFGLQLLALLPFEYSEALRRILMPIKQPS